MSTEPISFPKVPVPVGCQIPFSKLIYCTCIFPSLYLHSLPLCVYWKASISRAYWTQNGAPLQSACFRALSRFSRLPGHKRTRRLHAYTLKRALSKSHITSERQMAVLGKNNNNMNIKLLKSLLLRSSMCVKWKSLIIRPFKILFFLACVSMSILQLSIKSKINVCSLYICRPWNFLGFVFSSLRIEKVLNT